MLVSTSKLPDRLLFYTGCSARMDLVYKDLDTQLKKKHEFIQTIKICHIENLFVKMKVNLFR